jgi:PadR family transcriptional regulator PadR
VVRQRERHRGRRGGRRHRRRIGRFLEPCLLLLLHMSASYGYELAEALAQFGLSDVDSSLVYRNLREMEAAGLVQSEWDAASSAGPARRVYRLTDSGERHLAAWVADLHGIDRELHHFLETYDRHIREDKGERR